MTSGEMRVVIPFEIRQSLANMEDALSVSLSFTNHHRRCVINTMTRVPGPITVRVSLSHTQFPSAFHALPPQFSLSSSEQVPSELAPCNALFIFSADCRIVKHLITANWNSFWCSHCTASLDSCLRYMIGYSSTSSSKCSKITGVGGWECVG